jgi:hypothetical protein
MNRPALTLRVLGGTFAICRLPPEAPLPAWAGAGPLVSLTRTTEELSVVCAEEAVPPDVGRVGGWRALMVVGPLDFALTGILAALAGPLAAAGIALFALSTYDTDYLLVPGTRLAEAVVVLRQAGMTVEADPGP